MKAFLKTKLYFSAIILTVFVILVSNLGQDFKDDIFVYSNAMLHSNTLSSYWDKSLEYQNYIDSASKYIMNSIRDDGLSPLAGDKYIEEWTVTAPSLNGASTLEVLSDRDSVIKSYIYGRDFFENFKTTFASGSVKGKPKYIKDINKGTGYKLPKIILFGGYDNKTLSEIEDIDRGLKERGVECVISPGESLDLKYESDLYGAGKKIDKDALLKIMVTRDVFDKLIFFSNNNYKIRIKSSASIKDIKLKNVYGVLKGRNPSYKPLVILTSYDGIYKTGDCNPIEFKKNNITASIILEDLRCLKIQRLKKPDRTIIFVFSSGYMMDRKGIKTFLDKSIEGDYIILEGLGTGKESFVNYNNPSSNFSSLFEKFLRKNGFKIMSKSTSTNYDKSIISLTAMEQSKTPTYDYQTVYKAGRFLLSIVGDECYNLDFLSGNIRAIRIIKGTIRDYTLLLSLISLLFLIWFIFKREPNE